VPVADGKRKGNPVARVSAAFAAPGADMP